MASRKLKLLFAISIPIFMAHGLEELWTNFYSIDTHYHALFGAFDGMPVYKATLLLFNLMTWLWLITSLLLITDPKWQLRLAFLPMVLYVFELHHLLDIAKARGYTPGAITGLAFPILAVLYGRQWLKDIAAAKSPAPQSVA
jgi:hypothetical protein